MSRLLSLLIFLLVGSTLIAGWHFYLWMRLVRDPGLSLGVQRSLTLLLLLFGASMPLAMIGSRFAPPQLARLLSWFAFSWMGVAFLLLVLVGVGDLLHLGLRLWPAKWGFGGEALLHSPERRLFFSRALAAGSALVGLGMSGFGMREALAKVRLKTLEIPLAKLPAALDGLTVVQLTDIHLGSMIGQAFIEGLVQRCNALDPDLVVITGDLVDGSVAQLAQAVAPLAKLKTRHGVFFVTGNHEYYSGAEAWIAHLPSLGIQVLENRWVPIGAPQGPGLDLVGIPDPTGARMGPLGPDLGQALKGRNQDRALLLLAHQPRAIDEAVAHGVGLMLSGHTHGGQIWPFGMLVALNQPYVSGLHRRGDTQIYVSRGTGYWGPPMRIAAPPEITKIVLRATA